MQLDGAAVVVVVACPDVDDGGRLVSVQGAFREGEIRKQDVRRPELPDLIGIGRP